MMPSTSAFRVLAMVLIVALTLTLVAPARAEALEPLTVLAIAGVAVVVVILVAYLIAANARGGRAAAEPRVYVACIERAVDVIGACGQTVDASAAAVADTGAPALAMQSP